MEKESYGKIPGQVDKKITEDKSDCRKYTVGSDYNGKINQDKWIRKLATVGCGQLNKIKWTTVESGESWKKKTTVERGKENYCRKWTMVEVHEENLCMWLRNYAASYKKHLQVEKKGNC